MASKTCLVANPTDSDVTVDALVAEAHNVTELELSDAGNNAYDFLAAGCTVCSVDGATLQQRQEGAFLLYRLQNDAVEP